MPIPTASRYLLSVSSCVILLVGCSSQQTGLTQLSLSNQSTQLPQNTSQPSWMKVAHSNALEDARLLVGEIPTSYIFSYPENNRKNKPPVECVPGAIGGFTSGLAVDPAGNIWTVNQSYSGNPNSIEYSPNCGAQKLTIPDMSGQPGMISFNSKGKIYILDVLANLGLPVVNVYNSAGKQIKTLSDSRIGEGFGIGTDGNDNIFVAYDDPHTTHGAVIEFVHGTMPGTLLFNTPLGPGNPVFDAKNRLILTDPTAKTINIYAPPYTAHPTTKPLQGYAQYCVLAHSELRLYCADPFNNAVEVYSYPGITYLYSYTNGLGKSGAQAFTIATSPAAPL